MDLQREVMALAGHSQNYTAGRTPRVWQIA
jgi:hypothetical protein